MEGNYSKDNLPRALIVGPMKAGTSWIHDYLQARGDIALPNGVKETFFFDHRYNKGVGWYSQHFQHYDSSGHRLCVEVAPSYFHCEEAPSRVCVSLGDIPLVVTLRDPVRRAWSHYLHLYHRGYTKAPLQEAIVEFPEILEASRYQTCLSRWQTEFATEQIHILWLENLAHSVDDFAAELCQVLSLPYTQPAEFLYGRRNEARVPPSRLGASIGIRGGNMLRKYRLYGVVNFAKRLGLKEVFFGRPGKKSLPTLSDANAQWLERELEGEMPEDRTHGTAQAK